MIWYSVEQAAERVHRKPRTIQKWIRTKHLPARRNQIDGRLYVGEDDLLLAERDQRNAQKVTRFQYSQVSPVSATLTSH